MRDPHSEQGISVIEYAVLCVVLAAAVVSIAPMVKRALAGHFRAQADTFGRGRQYEPGVTQVLVTGCGRGDLPACPPGGP
jgi:Flp pilus assembly pilin Flp